MNALINQVRSKLYIVLYLCALSFLGFYFGFNIALYNTLADSLAKNYPQFTVEYIKTMQSILNTSFCIGSFICCFFGSIVYTKLGLYKSTLVFLSLNIVYDILACIPNLYILYGVRFFQGINGVMWTFLGPLMIQKCIFHDLKIQLQNMFYIMLAAGILVSNQFNLNWLGANYWMAYYFMLGVNTITFLVFRFGFRSIPSEEIINNKDLVSEEQVIDQLTHNLSHQYDQQIAYDLAKELILLNKQKTVQQPDSFSIKRLFEWQNRVQTLLVIFLNILNQLTGINIFIQYSQTILAQFKVPNISLIVSLISFANMFAGIVSTALSKILGLKYLLVLGLLFQSLAYQIFTYGMLKTLPICITIGAIFYMFGFGISLGASLYSYQTQIISQQSLSFASLFQWIFTILITYFGSNIAQIFNMYYLFSVFQFLALVGCFFVMKFGVRTEGKTFDQIQLEYLKKVK